MLFYFSFLNSTSYADEVNSTIMVDIGDISMKELEEVKRQNNEVEEELVQVELDEDEEEMQDDLVKESESQLTF